MTDCNTCKHNIENPPPHTCDACDSLDVEDYYMYESKDVYNNNENNFYIKLIYNKNGNEIEISKIKLSEYIDKISNNIVNILIPNKKS